MKNFKMRSKLLLSFGSVILLATCVVLFLLAGMADIAKSTDQLYSGPYQNVNSVWVLRRNVIDIQRLLNRFMAEGPETAAQRYASFETDIEQDVAEAKQAISDLETQIQSDDNRQRLAGIVEQVGQAEQIRPQVMELLRAGQFEEAYSLNYGTYLPIVDEINAKAVDLFDALTEDAQEFVDNADTVSSWCLTIGIALLVGGVLYSLFVALSITGMIVKPVQQITKAAQLMYTGDMSAAKLITYSSRDEIGVLADSLRGTMNNLDDYVQEISALLVQISSGDLTAPSGDITNFLGDFASIKESLVLILKRFNSTLTEIRSTADQVDSSAAQIAGAAQNLAAGSTEQASTLQQLSATIATLSEQVNQNADNAKLASQESADTGVQTERCQSQMERMMSAMQEINMASNEIGKIIKTIEDIAFQTNILALNAAVEAARAGSAGKGFAVVADEVRNLASKSAEASKDTAQLIETCVHSVENGAALANETAGALMTVVEKTGSVKSRIQHIAQQSEEQAASIVQVSEAVDQVAGVVQTNSATSEQSAATSAELSNQATQLDTLVQRFKLFNA